MKFLILGILSYLSGSLMIGYWIGKIIFNKNIRDLGSGNIGTTNTFRTLGLIPGLFTMILDILKGAIPVWVGFYFFGNNFQGQIISLFFGFIAVVGHVYSIFLNFHGGKAVATSAGVVLAFNPTFFLIVALVFGITLFISSIISVASISAFIFGTLYTWLIIHDNFLGIFAILATIIMLYAHRKNIIRIIKKEEPVINFGLYYWLFKKVK
ncbi:MAG: glycerol-3-phosphate 1-O-acyltransferase PlsY [Lactobacillaceae bacterium]|jgi:glycerol-3-phosphate acyltransferase PlsY|nr:glycerol-3-phosphate 1-O-acyltransferase PlsY [Lactobacillaceae bacterium]